MRMSFKTNGESGSVLMEFIIVLPIYMLLIGFAFVVGELSLQSIHLAGSADRTYAVSPSDFGWFKVAASPNKDDYDSGAESELEYKNDPVAGDTSAKASEYEPTRIDQVSPKAESFNAPWTKAVAAYVKDSYTLTPISRGMVAYWFRQKFNMTEDPKSAISSGDSALGNMLDNGIGRTDMVGKDLWDENEGKERPFGYYSLQRNDSARGEGTDADLLPYRKWPAGRLAGGAWDGKVYGEEYATGDYASLPQKRDGSSRLGDAPPGNPGELAAYRRDEDVLGWSND